MPSRPVRGTLRGTLLKIEVLAWCKQVLIALHRAGGNEHVATFAQKIQLGVNYTHRVRVSFNNVIPMAITSKNVI